MKCVVDVQSRNDSNPVVLKTITFETFSRQDIVKNLRKITRENKWRFEKIYFDIVSLDGYKPTKVMIMTINFEVRKRA